MKISKKSQYGLRGLVRLAESKKHIPIRKIAKEEGISSDYLEKIFTSLEKSGFVRSKRGPTGGYSLALRPENINLRMILEILENKFSLVECIDDKCDRMSNCPVASTWKKLDEEIKEKLELITIKNLLEENKL